MHPAPPQAKTTLDNDAFSWNGGYESLRFAAMLTALLVLVDLPAAFACRFGFLLCRRLCFVLNRNSAPMMQAPFKLRMRPVENAITLQW